MAGARTAENRLRPEVKAGILLGVLILGGCSWLLLDTDDKDVQPVPDSGGTGPRSGEIFLNEDAATQALLFDFQQNITAARTQIAESGLANALPGPESVTNAAVITFASEDNSSLVNIVVAPQTVAAGGKVADETSYWVKAAHPDKPEQIGWLRLFLQVVDAVVPADGGTPTIGKALHYQDQFGRIVISHTLISLEEAADMTDEQLWQALNMRVFTPDKNSFNPALPDKSTINILFGQGPKVEAALAAPTVIVTVGPDGTTTFTLTPAPSATPDLPATEEAAAMAEDKATQRAPSPDEIARREAIRDGIVIEGAVVAGPEMLFGGQMEFRPGGGEELYQLVVMAFASSQPNRPYFERLLGDTPVTPENLLEYLRTHDYILPYLGDGEPGLLLPYTGAAPGYVKMSPFNPVRKPVRLDGVLTVVFGPGEWNNDTGGVRTFIEEETTGPNLLSDSRAFMPIGYRLDTDGRLVMIAGNKAAGEWLSYLYGKALGGPDGDFDPETDPRLASYHFINLIRILQLWSYFHPSVGFDTLGPVLGNWGAQREHIGSGENAYIAEPFFRVAAGAGILATPTPTP